MITPPRYKTAKRLGVTVFEKAQTAKFALSADRSAKNKKHSGRGRQSEYGKQMLEKQKVRLTYGITEKQFRSYVNRALDARDAKPVEHLHELLEMRLDNVVWRLGLASTRRGARQMVAHGHVCVNGKKIRVPSHLVKVGETIAVREGSKSHGVLTGFADRFVERPLPSWLSWDPKTMSGSVTERPTASSADPAGDLTTVLSFYTR
ncbi:30S ribosomal protein S4 [Candidatus Kaiserbacteria bacterium CG10_big_fil_rev_8_21_14_0_10_56_12]|uniref:Small ribosomal subunit protein uS4 n=1 Tax=Candidatus Kaiserbacteria bacterium CG10_big_fil_rev_8_21_14_0_10_56_12 TaxID=1974611 RepID=A0A2H0UA19_9BACT|nr:MAG: 30S ribosomal protein S4 [Candidatus Kaiserbacteria bacterium CG10_big_fil_rev_8_21_14_0_10_56_12]